MLLELSLRTWRFYTLSSVFLLYPDKFFHPLFSHNKDLLRKRLKLVQEEGKWHS